MTVRVAVGADGVAEIVLDRPPVNAVDLALADDLIAALRRCGEDADVRAIVVSSANPKVFSAGLDLALMRRAAPAEIRAMLTRLYLDLADAQAAIGKPTIAAVAGAARGAGVTMAVACDTLLADESATFAYPEIDVGLIPGIHLVGLPRLAGRHAAFDLLFTGRSFGAAEARDLGLVSRVVPAGDVRMAALALGRELAAKPPGAMRAGRAAFRAINDGPNDRAAIAGTIDLLCDLLASAEAQGRLAAFFGARPERPSADP